MLLLVLLLSANDLATPSATLPTMVTTKTKPNESQTAGITTLWCVCVFVVGVVMLLSVSLLSSVVGGGVIVAMVLDHAVGNGDTIASVVYCVRVVFVVAGNVIHPLVCSQPFRDGDLVRT